MDFKAKKTLAEAWEITEKNKKNLFWYGFLPSFFALGVGAIVVYFQYILLKNSSFFTENTKSIFDIAKPIIKWIFDQGDNTLPIIGVIIFFLVSSYILPVFSEGAIILMTKNRNENNEMKKGFGKGLSVFLPLFEFSFVQGGIRPYSIILEFLFFIRMFGQGSIIILKPILVIILFLSFIALFFFNFVSSFIAIEKQSMSESLISSFKFVGRFFTETFNILILFIFIELRTVFNVVIIFLLPFLLISIGGAWAESIFGIIVLIVIGITLLSFASIISGILFVYKNVAWTLAFLQLKSIQEKEDS